MATFSGVWEVFWCFPSYYSMREKIRSLLPDGFVLISVDPLVPLKSQVANADVLLPCGGIIDEEVLQEAKKLKLIAQPAAGYDTIDVAACKKFGIPVTNCAGANVDAVAEQALLLMLMLCRRVREQQAVFQERGLGHPCGFQLAGKTLAVIGMGAIGKTLARVAEGISMTVIGTSSTTLRPQFEEALRSADVVVLTCPLNKVTRDLIGDAELALMKKGSLLINVSRGPVINKEALERALESGHLGGAGLDVHWVEPADPWDPLYQHPSVVAMPHAAGATVEVMDTMADIVVQNIIRMREGRELIGRLC